MKPLINPGEISKISMAIFPLFLIACQSPHLAKIQGMESISKPQLLEEVYTI
jgi:hypothetical protein